ncbi:MAG: metallophosphoesterase [Planctomycetota bacterium]|nr:metallophosphoesterase [Planctomycetota bacterium]
MSTPGTGSVARPTAAANNIAKFRDSSPAAPVLKPAAAAAAPARPLAPPSGQVVRTLLGAIKSGPVILGVGLAAAVDLLTPRPVNQSEVRWLTRRRADQFVGDLKGGVGVAQALSRLSAGLFVNDISLAKFQAERSGLAKAIARQDSTAALRHFETIAKAMAFDPSATNAGVAAVGREIARLKNASVPRLSAPVSLRAPGKAQGASNLQHTAQAARTQRSLAPKTSPNRLPALGGSRAATPPQPARLGRKSQVTHTGNTSTQVGEGAAALARLALERHLRELETARRLVYEARKTQWIGGSVDDVARQVYARMGGQATLGMSEAAFVSLVQAPGTLAGGDGGGSVRASAGGSGGGRSIRDSGGSDATPNPTVDNSQLNGAFLALQDASDFSELVATLNTLREKSWFSNWLNTSEAHDAIVTALSRIWGQTIDLKSGDRTETLATFARAMTRKTADELAKLGTDVIVRLLEKGGVYGAGLNDYNRRLSEDLPLSAPGTISPDIQELHDAVTLLLQAQGISRPGSEGDQSLITGAMGRPFDTKDGRVTSPLLLTPDAPFHWTAWQDTGLRPTQHLFAIGDVHGNMDLLEALLKKVGELANAPGISIREFLVVTLGDYLNKGKNPARVLALLRALDMSSQPGNTALDKETERALDELGLLGLGNFIALAGNHEEPGGSYSGHLNILSEIDLYARETASMLDKGLLDTIRSYLAEYPGAFSPMDHSWLTRALTKFPSPQATRNSGNQRAGWTWRGASSRQGEMLGDEQAHEFYRHFRKIWVGAFQEVGHLDFFNRLRIAFQEGPFLLTHGAPPVKLEQMRDLQAYLNENDSKPLPPNTQRHLIWTRALEIDDLLKQYSAISAAPGGVVFGHTMGGAYQRDGNKLAFGLDLGFGRNMLAMLAVKPDGRATLITARRTAQGIQVFAVPPSEFLPRLGNRALANRL